jgi:hypothetical protein
MPARAPLIVLAVAFLFVGGLFFLIGGRPLLEAWRYRHAIRVEAVVTAAALRPATETSGTRYEISYHAIAEGRATDRTEAVPVHLWESAGASSRAPVEYLPGRPETVRVSIEDAAATRKSIIFAAIGTLLIAGGTAAATRAARRRPPTDAPRAVDAPIAIRAHPTSYWPRARRSPQFWTGAIILVVATPLVIATLPQILEEWRFARSGVSTDGMILTKDIMRSGRSTRSRGYGVTYRVMVPEGAFENRVAMPFDRWSRLNERQTVEVLYLPERPAMNRLTGSQEWKGAAVLGTIGSAFFLVGATMFRRSVRQARLAWRLEQRGAAATAVIVEIADRHLKINEVRQFRLRYEYDDFQARRHSATHDMAEEEALRWNVGDKGAVRYDPGRPADSIWLGRENG